MTALLPKVETEAKALADEIFRARGERGARWQLSGPPTAGKSACLRQLRDELARGGLVPIVASPPPKALDAGPLALMQIAEGLKGAGLINGPTRRLLDGQTPWVSKTEVIRSALASAANKVVLLCDELNAWSPRTFDDRHFAEVTMEVVGLIEASPCPVVMTGFTQGVPRNRRHELQPASAPIAWLRTESAWGRLAVAAEELARVAAPRLTAFSPLEVRLLVLLTYLTNASQVERGLRFGEARRELAGRVIDALREGHGDVLTVWARLALIRESFPQQILEELAGALSGEQRDIVRYGLLYGDAGKLRLHDTLRRDVRALRCLTTDQEQETHALFANYYRDVFGDSDDWNGGVLAEMEAFHHASLAADGQLLDELRVFFVVQLDALGKRLSLRAQREKRPSLFQRAVGVFERALEWDDSDDYAHHYLAFNLDVEGREASQVEKHYREATKHQPSNVYWWSRLVTFLITRGRIADAGHAWNEALDALGIPDDADDSYTYHNLHLWVARLLIHRGKLDFAQQVLDGVPATMLREHPGLRAIVRRLEALAEARERGAFVPGPALKRQWWETGPQLLPESRDDTRLARWWAVRVDRIDEGVLHLRAAEVRENDEPEVGVIEVPFLTFDDWTQDEKASTLEPGRFLELGKYEPGDEMVARVHRNVAWQDDDLPPLWPDPARYLLRRS